jgi:hypothetical protein
MTLQIQTEKNNNRYRKQITKTVYNGVTSNVLLRNLNRFELIDYEIAERFFEF